MFLTLNGQFWKLNQTIYLSCKFYALMPNNIHSDNEKRIKMTTRGITNFWTSILYELVNKNLFHMCFNPNYINRHLVSKDKTKANIIPKDLNSIDQRQYIDPNFNLHNTMMFHVKKKNCIYIPCSLEDSLFFFFIADNLIHWTTRVQNS
jgi:hypothetical protein